MHYRRELKTYTHLKTQSSLIAIANNLFIIKTLNIPNLARNGSLTNNTQGSSQKWLNAQRILCWAKSDLVKNTQRSS